MPWQTCSDRPSTILCRRSEAPALGSLFPSICTALSIASAAAVCLHRNHCQHIPSNQQFNNLPFERFQHVDHPFSDVLASLDDGILPYAPLPRKGKAPSDTGGAPKCRLCASISSACIRRTSAKAPMLSSQSMSVFCVSLSPRAASRSPAPRPQAPAQGAADTPPSRRSPAARPARCASDR